MLADTILVAFFDERSLAHTYLRVSRTHPSRDFKFIFGARELDYMVLSDEHYVYRPCDGPWCGWRALVRARGEQLESVNSADVEALPLLFAALARRRQEKVSHALARLEQPCDLRLQLPITRAMNK